MKTLPPGQGPTETFGERFRGHVAQSPALFAAMKGADEAQLRTYTKVAFDGAALPAVLRAYLQIAGTADGGLFRSACMDATVGRLVSFYASNLKWSPDEVSRELPAIAVMDMGGAAHLDLRPGAVDNPPVVRGADGDIFECISTELERFLFRQAFRKVELERYTFTPSWPSSKEAHQASAANGQVPERVVAFAQAQQAELLWFSDPNYWFMDHPEGLVVVDHWGGVNVEIYADAPGPLEAIVAPFAYSLGCR